MRLVDDAVGPLLASGNDAVAYFTRRDLQGEYVGPIQVLWALPEVLRLVGKQLADGSWPSRNRRAQDGAGVDYGLIETWKQFRHLIEKYALTREHPAVEKAAEFVFSRLTAEGDIRGILADQPAIYYTGAILSLLVRAGYEDDPCVERAFRWLLRMRQDDGGWVATPSQTCDSTAGTTQAPGRHDRSKPFSHIGTGMALRAFAHHPRHRNTEAARAAARLLASRFFLAARYTSYRHPHNWLRFGFPFWWNDLVAALDTVSRIIPQADEHVHAALACLIDHQQQDGLWSTSYSRIHKQPPDTAKSREERLWITLVICGFMKRFGVPLRR